MPRKKSPAKMIASRETAGDFWGFGSLPKPDRVLEKLSKDAYTAYQDILTDDHLSGVMESRAAAVKQLEWDVVRGDASAAAAKAVKKLFEKLDIDGFIDAILLANAYGMSPIEVSWEIIDGLHIPVDLHGKPARWFTFNDKNELRFLKAGASTDGVEIPPERILLPRNNPTYENPYGDALLSKSYWPIIFKKNTMRWWNRFTERYGMPWIWGKLPRNKTGDTEKDELLLLLTEAIQDAVIVTPDDSSVELIEAGGKGASADIYLKFLQYCDSAVSKIWLGETLTTEIQDKGSYAAANTQQGTKDERKRSDKIMVCRIANELISWIVRRNYGGSAPEFILVEEQAINKDLAERDGILAEKMGFRPKKEYFVKTYGHDEDDFEIVEPQQAAPPPDETGLSFAALSRFKDQAAVDNGIAKLTQDKELQAQAEELLKPVLKLIRESKSYSEVLEKLLLTFDGMSTDEAEKWLQSGVFTSEVIGHLSGGEK